MFGQWYNSSLRKYCVMMGDLFSHVQVMRKDEDDKIHLQRVPISFSSKERFVEKLDTITSVNNDNKSPAKVEIILPRLCLSLVDIVYNASYKTNISNRMLGNPRGSKKLISQYNPVPIKMIFELGMYTRHQDDMFQLIEQIWPYFQPHFTTTLTELQGNDIEFERDIRVVLQSMSLDNQLETDRTTRRRLESSFIFEVNGWLYPPVAEIKGEIRTIYIDIFANEKAINSGVFESTDSQVDPVDVGIDDWNGNFITGESAGIPIPKAPTPPHIRRN